MRCVCSVTAGASEGARCPNSLSTLCPLAAPHLSAPTRSLTCSSLPRHAPPQRTLSNTWCLTGTWQSRPALPSMTPRAFAEGSRLFSLVTHKNYIATHKGQCTLGGPGVLEGALEEGCADCDSAARGPRRRECQARGGGSLLLPYKIQRSRCNKAQRRRGRWRAATAAAGAAAAAAAKPQAATKVEHRRGCLWRKVLGRSSPAKQALRGELLLLLLLLVAVGVRQDWQGRGRRWRWRGKREVRLVVLHGQEGAIQGLCSLVRVKAGWRRYRDAAGAHCVLGEPPGSWWGAAVRSLSQSIKHLDL